MLRQEIVELNGHRAWLLRSTRGCAIYTLWSGGASIDTHRYSTPTVRCMICEGSGVDEDETCWKCDGTGEQKMHRCCWLGDHFGDCDGTSLARVLFHEQDVWSELAHWVP